MTDNGTGGTAMDLSAESSVDDENQAIAKKRAEIDFRKMERDRDIQLYKVRFHYLFFFTIKIF